MLAILLSNHNFPTVLKDVIIILSDLQFQNRDMHVLYGNSNNASDIIEQSQFSNCT